MENRATPATPPAAPTRVRLFRRGLVRHCPVCGSGHLFEHYFKLKPQCPHCGLRFQRLEGQWSGDIGINTIVTFGLLYVVLMVGVIGFGGRVNVGALAAVGIAVVLVFPVAFVPFAKTLWLAIDLMMRPVEAAEFASDAAATPDRSSVAGSAPRPH